MPLLSEVLEAGWPELTIGAHAVSLTLSLLWLAVYARRRVVRKTTSSRPSNGIVAALPIVVWALEACLQAGDATAIDLYKPYTRYPYFWAYLTSSVIVGLVIVTLCTMAYRVSEPKGSHLRLPTAGVVTAASSWILVALAWVAVFARETALPRGAP